MSTLNDPAWEEYLSTGIDPTGGELSPDFDPETGAPLEESIDAYFKKAIADSTKE